MEVAGEVFQCQFVKLFGLVLAGGFKIYGLALATHYAKFVHEKEGGSAQVGNELLGTRFAHRFIYFFE